MLVSEMVRNQLVILGRAFFEKGIACSLVLQNLSLLQGGVHSRPSAVQGQ